MDEMVDRDLEHLRLLKMGYYVMAGIAVLNSFFPLLLIGGGILLMFVRQPANDIAGMDPQIVGYLLMCTGSIFLVFAVGGAIAYFMTARALRDRRRRTFCMLVAAFNCLSIPWGTVLGAGTLVVLNRERVKALFNPPPIHDQASDD